MVRFPFAKPRHLLLAAAACFAIAISPSAAAVEIGGVAPVQNPQTYKDCQELGMRWYEKRKTLENANRVCERRDGGTVRAAGVWMPNCNSRQQAYVTCASISDQMCWVDNQQQEALSTCHRDLAANQKEKQNRETAAGKLDAELKELQKARDNAALVIERGPAAALLQNYVTSPGRARDRFQEALVEAARTTGTRAPDSQPELNLSGAASDMLHRANTPNAAIAEVGSQSAAAARARMGDALNQLEGARSRTEAEGYGANSSATPAPSYVRPVPSRNVADDEEAERAERRAAREQAAANYEMVRQMNQAMRDATNSINASRGIGGSTPSAPRSSGSSSNRCGFQRSASSKVDC